MIKSKIDQAKALALRLNQVILDDDGEITIDVLFRACATLLGTATAVAGERERDVVHDMEVFGTELQDTFQSCRASLTRH